MEEDKGPAIQLTEHEAKLFELLKAVEAHFQLSTVMRVAGGWVRDKIMGLDSHDIDIALDNMSGNAFAMKVNEYLELKGEETHSIGVIQSNPDQSKHLETATVKVLGSWIDFVNLRSETYADDSRIPSQVGIGTPEQDAHRRDLTINALFYNINISAVEDFTGRGVSDIASKIIRTPLPPYQTFMDDPLRVLRAFRFASRLPGFEVAPELMASASDPDVVDALAKKITRERIGKELDGMLLAARPELAFNWISLSGLFPVVFALPPSLNQPIDEENSRKDAVFYARQLMRFVRTDVALYGSQTPTRVFSYDFELDLTDEERRITCLAAALLPYSTATFTTPKKRVDTVDNHIVLNSIKRPNADADTVATLHFGANHFAPLFAPSEARLSEIDHQDYLKNAPLASQAVKLGRIMRRLGPIWKHALALALIRAQVLPDFSNSLSINEIDANLATESLERFNQVVLEIRSLAMHLAHDMKPFFSGDHLKDLLSLSPGPIMGIALDREIDWMLENLMAVVNEREATLELCRAYLLDPEFKPSIEAEAANFRKKKK